MSSSSILKVWGLLLGTGWLAVYAQKKRTLPAAGGPLPHQNVLLKNPKLPWILLVLSWTYFYFYNSSIPPTDWIRWAKKRWLGFNYTSSAKHTAIIKKSTASGLSTTSTASSSSKEGGASGTSDINDQNLLKTKNIQEIISHIKQKEPGTSELIPGTSVARGIFSLVFSKPAWTSLSETDGVQISTLSVGGLDLPMVRGDGIIAQGERVEIEDVLAVIQSPLARKTWDARFQDSRGLKFVEGITETIGYSTQKGTFPVAARDFVVGGVTNFSKEGSEAIYLVFSLDENISGVLDDNVKQSLEKESSGKVRGEILVAAWHLIKNPKGQIEATYLVHVDVKGSVPSSIIKSIQTQTPLCIRNISQYLSKNSNSPPFPYILQGETYKMRKEIKVLSREVLEDGRVLEVRVQIPPIKAEAVKPNTTTATEKAVESKKGESNKGQVPPAVLPAILPPFKELDPSHPTSISFKVPAGKGCSITVTPKFSHHKASAFKARILPKLTGGVQVWIEGVPEEVEVLIKISISENSQVSLNGVALT